MLIAPKPDNEDARLRVLHNLRVLDTEPEAVFDRITRLVSHMLEVPIALVSLVDANRQWFKSSVGLSVCETPRDIAFCAHALNVKDVLIIEDAQADQRFSDNPLVTGEPHIRFYAGVPLRSNDGLVMGTLCALDAVPRTLSHAMIDAFKDLASIVERELLQRATVAQGMDIYRDEHQARTLSDARFAAVFRQTPTGNAIIDLTGRFCEVNARLCEIVGYAEQQLLGKAVADVTFAPDFEAYQRLITELLEHRQESCTIDARYIRQDESLIWVELCVSLFSDRNGQPLYFIAVALDITLRKKNQEILLSHQQELEHRVARRTQELERSKETLQKIADNLPILIAQVDPDLCYLFNNDVYTQIFGVTPAQLKGKSIRDTLRPDLFAQLLPYFTRALKGERACCENVRYSLEQERVWQATYIPDIREGEVVGFFVMSQDVTEAWHIERSLRDEAMHDTLTGLPNRRALLEVMKRDAAAPHLTSHALAVLFMDLDGFKSVNDRYGHAAGDELLKQVAGRLRLAMHQNDFISRLAGDEFVALISDVQSLQACGTVAQGICHSLCQPFDLPHATVGVGVSIGIAFSTDVSTESAEQLLKRADAAMYEAKRKGRNSYQFG